MNFLLRPLHALHTEHGVRKKDEDDDDDGDEVDDHDDDDNDDDGDDVDDDDEEGEDGDGSDGDDAQKMNGLLSCGQTKYNILLAVTMVSIMTIFSPLELRMKHAKSKTVHKTHCNCVIQTTLNH